MKNLTPTGGVLHFQGEDATYRVEYTTLANGRLRASIYRDGRLIGVCTGRYVISVRAACHLIRHLELIRNN